MSYFAGMSAIPQYLGLSVSLYFHAGVYTRPDNRKFAALTALLHRSRGFLNAAGERGQGFGSGDRSGGLICLVNDTSPAADRKRYVFVPLLESVNM